MCALVTGVQTFSLPICRPVGDTPARATHPDSCPGDAPQMGIVLLAWPRHIRSRPAGAVRRFPGLRYRTRTPEPANTQSRQAFPLAPARSPGKQPLAHPGGTLADKHFLIT